MNSTHENPLPERAPDATSKTQLKIALLVCLIAAFGILFLLFREQLTLQALANREGQLRTFQQTQPAATYTLAFLLYVLVTALSLPGATAMTLAYAWLFGFWPALLLVSFASTTGATAAFSLSRYLLGESIQRRFSQRLTSFNEALRREGPFFLFTLRLIPLVPFFVINVVMGLTPMRTSTFWWISQLGMLPGTSLYVYAGSSVPQLQEIADQGISRIFTLRILVAFALLGLFPFLVRFLVAQVRRRTLLLDFKLPSDPSGATSADSSNRGPEQKDQGDL